jgi:hypothetical protein
MMLSRRASRSVADTLCRTAFSAQSAFRPRSRAIVRTKAAASFSIFFIDSLSTWPPTATGCAAPMFVAGAMAATCAASVMKAPADAARAPVGDTYTITGSGALSISRTIDRIERSRPPAGGVELDDEGGCAFGPGPLDGEPHEADRRTSAPRGERVRRRRAILSLRPGVGAGAETAGPPEDPTSSGRIRASRAQRAC